MEELELAEAGPGPVREAAGREVRAHLTQALAELPQGQREVFELGAVQGLPYGEVAELLGIPVGTVKSRMFHAVRRMRQLLEGAEDPS